MKKRILSVILSSLILASASLSVSAADRALVSDGLSDMNFNGAKVKIMTSDFDSIIGEDNKKNEASQAVYERNKAVENRLGIKFEYVNSDSKTLSKSLTDAQAAGNADYGIYAADGFSSSNLAANGSMSDIKENEYIDLSKPYWNDDFTNGMSANGKVFFINGDANSDFFGSVYVTYFNRTKLNDVIQDTDLYADVRNGKWTLDKLISYSNSASVDMDNDGKIGVYDFSGFVYSVEDAIEAIAFGSGVKFADRDSAGNPFYALSDGDALLNFAVKIKEIYDSPASYQTALADGDKASTAMNVFSERNALFTVGYLKEFKPFSSVMKDKVGYLPMPKGTESQNDYVSSINQNATIIGIPSGLSADNEKTAGAALEALASYSYNNVTVKYLDYITNGVYGEDNNSHEMIDLSIDNLHVDFAYQYPSVGLNNILRSMIKMGDKMPKRIETNAKNYSNAINKLVESMK